MKKPYSDPTVKLEDSSQIDYDNIVQVCRFFFNEIYLQNNARNLRGALNLMVFLKFEDDEDEEEEHRPYQRNILRHYLVDNSVSFIIFLFSNCKQYTVT